MFIFIAWALPVCPEAIESTVAVEVGVSPAKAKQLQHPHAEQNWCGYPRQARPEKPLVPGSHNVPSHRLTSQTELIALASDESAHQSLHRNSVASLP